MTTLPGKKPPAPAPTVSDLIRSAPVALAYKILGDRWSLLILRDVFTGVRRFEDLRRRSGAARGTLTSRLNALVENGVLYRNPYQSTPTRYEYRLTDKGFETYPAALMLWTWEQKWTDDHDELPRKLIHKLCGKETIPELRCEACNEIVVATDVKYLAGPAARHQASHEPQVQRRRRSKTLHPEGVDKTFFHAVDIVGDRWTGMVLAAIWFSQHRYDDIAAAIGIATNILSDRLKLLTMSGVLERRRYRDNPVRYEYRLTEKGRDLYGFTVMLHQWGDDWLVSNRGEALRLEHSCGKPLACQVTCSACPETLQPGSVSYKT